MPLPQTMLQDIKKSFEYVHWDVTIHWISPETLLNSTTFFMLKWVLQAETQGMSCNYYFPAIFNLMCKNKHVRVANLSKKLDEKKFKVNFRLWETMVKS